MLTTLSTALLCFCHQDMKAQSALIAAVSSGNVNSARKALHAGASPDSREQITTKPSLSENEAGGRVLPGRFALGIAIDRASVPLVQLLLGAKANPNSIGEYGWTPLMSACQGQNLEIIKLLLKAGAKPNLLNDYGDTAITFAANRDNVPAMDLLVKAGADVNGGKGQTPLVTAIMSSAPKSVKFLLSKGANPNLKRGGFWTPLEYSRAEYYGSEEVEKMILKAGGKGRSRKALDAETKDRLKLIEAERKKLEAPIVPENAALAPITAEDTDVIKVALLSFLTGKKPLFNDEYPNIVVINELRSYLGSYLDDQMNSELDERKANDITLEMRKNFVQRNVKSQPLKAIEGLDKRILFRNSDSITRSFRGVKPYEKDKAKGWVQISLPGYSEDHTKAFLRFHFGPTAHGAAGTVLLEKNSGNWTVKWCDTAFYM